MDQVVITDGEAGFRYSADIRRKETLAAGRHGFVFVLPPTEQTHGRHREAARLAIGAVERLPAGGGASAESLFARLKAAPACACS